MTTMKMTQEAPYPAELQKLVNELHYKPGWIFTLEDTDRGQDSKGLTLVASVTEPDGYHPERRRTVLHYQIVPAASYNRASWRRWLFDQIGLIEQHERCEHFVLVQETDAGATTFRPYAPNHGPGNEPSTVRELTTDEERRTSFRGVIKPAE